MEQFRITFYNAGRQDAILIESNDKVIFIDGGTYSMNEKLIPWLKAMKIAKIDLYIASHSHANHIGVAAPLMKEFAVSTVWASHEKVKAAILAQAKTAGQKTIVNAATFSIIKKGYTETIGGSTFVCLGPDKITSCGVGDTAENYNSLIFKLTYGDKKILLCGDTSDSILTKALAAEKGAFDIYKNHHHNGATAKTLLKKIMPAYTVVCHSAKPSLSYQGVIKAVKSTLITVCTSSYGTTSFTFTKVGSPFNLLHHGQRIVNGIPTFARLLKAGMSGPDVKMMQERLRNSYGYDFLVASGTYDEDTVDAVGMFRRNFGVIGNTKVNDKQWSSQSINTMMDAPLWAILWKDPAAVIPTKRPGYLIDVSEYDPIMPGKKIKHVVDLVIIRASIGMKKDASYEKHVKTCKENGIPFSVYHYVKGNTVEKVRAEAEFFYRTAQKDHPTFFYADIEYDGIKNNKARELMDGWLDVFESKADKPRLGFYIANHRRRAMNLEENRVEVVWVPSYGENNGDWDGKTNPYDACDLHQFGSLFYINCVARRKDANRIPKGGRRTVAFLQGKER